MKSEAVSALVGVIVGAVVGFGTTYIVPERKSLISTDFHVQHDAWLVETR